jgi:hypothetical protein
MGGFLSNRTEADFQAWRDGRDWTAEKYRRSDRGERMPPGQPLEDAAMPKYVPSVRN